MANGIPPWAYGPFELIKHAEEHLKGGTDFDKRMALISFDNAIEVAITSYLLLHPMQRGGQTYPREATERWLASYHSKLDFFEKHLTSAKQTINVTMAEVAWYHGLRNELYHSGNGFVPEQRHLAGVREAALGVFSILYQINAEVLLSVPTPSPRPLKDAERPERSIAMQFLQSFIKFERALREPEQLALGSVAVSSEKSATPSSVRKAWRLFKAQRREVPDTYDEVVTDAIRVRNAIVHGSPLRMSSEEIEKLSSEVNKLLNLLTGHEGEARPKRTRDAEY